MTAPERLGQGEALREANADADRKNRKYLNTRANQRALARAESEETIRVEAHLRGLKADTMQRHPEWFA